MHQLTGTHAQRWNSNRGIAGAGAGLFLSGTV
jgi:hypothetical protein